MQLYESLEDYVPQLFAFLRTQPDNVVVHFTNWSSVGYNIKPTHQDPMGVYTFPKKYILSPEFSKRNGHFFSMKNAFVLRPNSSKILNLSTITLPEAQNLSHKMMGVDLTDGTGHHSILSGRASGRPGHALWDTMEKFLLDKNYSGKTKNFQWTKMLLNAGVDILLDDGDSIIHQNEPHQVVFLRPGTYQEITNFTHVPNNIYSKLALNVMNKLADKLFDDKARITTSRKYSDITIYAKGKYQGKPVTVYGVYYKPEYGMRYALTMKFGLGSDLQASHTSLKDDDARLEVPFELDKPVDQSVDKLVTALKSILDEEGYFRTSNAAEAKAVTAAAMRLLGVSGVPSGDREEHYSFKKMIKGYGLLMGNLMYSAPSKYKEDFPNGSFYLGLSLKPLKTESYHQYPMLYGGDHPEIGREYMEQGADFVALRLIRKNINHWKETVDRHYPTDEDRYKPDDYRSWESMKTGKHFTKFIEKMEGIIASNIK